MNYNPFDLFIFSGENSDYECFVEKSVLWSHYGVVETCDFVTRTPLRVRRALFEYYVDTNELLNA